MKDPRRRIPAVERLLAAEELRALVEERGRERVTRVLRELQDRLRTDPVGMGMGEGPPTDPAWYAARARLVLDRQDRPSLRRVINATGVVIHTNLGRAPLAEAALRAIGEAAGYATLEYDLERGERGSRHDHCAALLRELTGAPAAMVVNNNAAAVLLAVSTLSAGAEAVISRGELVEIGGSFRVPEIIARSGARLREVGATNRTHLSDYRSAIGPGTGVVLKVHRSNFRMEGFTSEVSAAELSTLAMETGVPLLHDLGSGALLDLASLGLPAEPTARDAIAAGAAVVTMSGDKLLGGPQAGILLGEESVLHRLRSNPLARTLRPDKLTLAALEATLALYRDPDAAVRTVPVLRMLAAPPGELDARAASLRRRLLDAGVDCATRPDASAVGGGAYPGVELPTVVVALNAPEGADELAERLRKGDPPVVARVRDDRVLLDPRTIAPEEEDALVAAVAEQAGSRGSEKPR